MTILFNLLLRWGVPLKLARPLAYLIAAIALLALLWGLWSLWLSSHDRGVVEKHETAIEARVQTQGRAADQNMMGRKAQRQAEVATDREEFNNATAHLPKSGLTARQRVDACNELRRQGTDQAILSRAGCV